MGEGRPARIHPFASTTYAGRVLITALGHMLIASVFIETDRTMALVILAAGLIYPHLVYLLATRSGKSRTVGLISFFIDSTITGLWVVALSYSAIATVVIILLTLSVPLIMGGLKLALWVFIPFLVVTGLGLFVVEADLRAHTTGLPFLLTMLMNFSYVIYIAWLTNRFGFALITARKNLEAQNVKIQSQAALLESMNAVAHLVNSTVDIDQVLFAIRDSLAEIFPFDQFGLLMLDEHRETLAVEKYIGDQSPEIIEQVLKVRIPISETGSIFVATVNARKPIHVADTQAVKSMMTPSDARIQELLPNFSIVTFPLIIDNEVVGVLALSHSRQFKLEREAIAAAGRYIAFIATAIRKLQLNEGLLLAQQEAVAANEAKSQFLANMSHELRTPMNAVIGYAEMLAEEAEDQGLDSFKADLERIRSASKHLLGLINNVLDLSKIEAAKVELYAEESTLGNLVQELADTSKPLAAVNGNTLEIEVTDGDEVLVIDLTKLRQAALNLLGNACKFTRNGSIRLSAHICNRNGRRWLNIAISDTGIGMNAEQIAKVFKPFEQADAATTRHYGGTGLGLSISKAVCELMGGDILLESEPGKGSTFTIRVPADAREVQGNG
jgi:signal transduction histidine kinase